MTPHKTAINSSETFKEYLKITLASGLSGYFFSVAVTWVTSNIIITANHELVSFMLKIFTGTSISVWMDAYFFIAFGGGLIAGSFSSLALKLLRVAQATKIVAVSHLLLVVAWPAVLRLHRIGYTPNVIQIVLSSVLINWLGMLVSSVASKILSN